MKCYAVNIMTLEGEYKSVYLGNDLAKAKKINKEYRVGMLDKDCMAVFFFPKPYSKRVSGQARHFQFLEKEKAEVIRKKKKHIDSEQVRVKDEKAKEEADAVKADKARIKAEQDASAKKNEERKQNAAKAEAKAAKNPSKKK